MMTVHWVEPRRLIGIRCAGGGRAHDVILVLAETADSEAVVEVVVVVVLELGLLLLLLHVI